MSLITGMSGITVNPEAEKIAEEMMMLEDGINLENDAVIEAMITGLNPFEDRSDLDDEDEFCNDPSNIADESLNSLDSFLASLVDDDDPIRTHSGSLGYKDSKASFDDNYSDDLEDDDDPIRTHSGSLGYKDSKANFNSNFSDASRNKDNNNTSSGSIGQKGTSAKDPAMESELFLASLAEDEDDSLAMEGWLSNKIQKHYDDRFANDLRTLGMPQYDNSHVNKLYENKKYDAIINYLTKWKNNVLTQAGKISDPNNKKEIKAKQKAAKRLVNMANIGLVAFQSEKMMMDEMAKGADKKAASKIVRKKIRDYEKALKDSSKLDSATEAAFDIVENWLIADESASMDDESNGNTVGTDMSKANFEGNYSNGNRDTKSNMSHDGSEGYDDSQASFEDNFAGYEIDDDDPILTGNGSVGQKNSTAKDPAHESFDFIDEDEEDEAMEAFFEELDYSMDIAEESIFGSDFDRRHMIKAGPLAKKAKKLMKEGKRAKRKKAYSEAISLFKEAKKIYQKLLDTAKNMRNEVVNKDAHGSSFNTSNDGNLSGLGYFSSKGDTISRNTDQKNHVINWCMMRIEDCNNKIDSIKDKIASESYIGDEDEWDSYDDPIDMIMSELNDEFND